jgi:hypothetical protein
MLYVPTSEVIWITIGYLYCEWASKAQGRARKERLDRMYSRETQINGAEKSAGDAPQYLETELKTNPKSPK